MATFALTSLVTNHYEIEGHELSLRQSQVSGLYLAVLNGCIPLAPAYPEGYLSIDLLTIDHLLWSGCDEVFVQNSRNRRYFQLTFSDNVTAKGFVKLLRLLVNEDLIEQIRTPVEMEIISSSWTSGRLDAATLAKEPFDDCCLMQQIPVTTMNSPPTTPPSSLLLHQSTPSSNSSHLRSPSLSPSGVRKPKAQPITKICQSHQETLEYIFTTGRWSDLTIVAGHREFNVHKAIVCPRSCFFTAALSSEFEEARSCKITLDEAPAVIEAIMQFLYDQSIELYSKPPLYTFALATDPEKIRAMSAMIDTYTAADKYGIKGIQSAMVDAISARLPFLSKPDSLISVAEHAYTTTPYRDGQACAMRDVVVAFLKTHLKAILLDSAASAAVLGNRTLMFDLLGHFADSSSSPEKLRQSTKRDREGMADGATDGRRKSLRARQHVTGTYRGSDVSKAS